jgi:hypothetical protein
VRLSADLSSSSNLHCHPTFIGGSSGIGFGVVDALFSSLDLGGETLDHIVYTAGNQLAAKALDGVNLKFVIKARMVRFFRPNDGGEAHGYLPQVWA